MLEEAGETQERSFQTLANGFDFAKEANEFTASATCESKTGCLTYSVGGGPISDLYNKIGTDLAVANNHITEYKKPTHEDLVGKLETVSKQTLSAASNPASPVSEIEEDLRQWRTALSGYKKIDVRPILRGLISDFSEILKEISQENRRKTIVFDSKPEIAAQQQTVLNRLQSNLSSRIDNMQSVLKAVPEGDLPREITHLSFDRYTDSVRADLESLKTSLTLLVRERQTAFHEITNPARQSEFYERGLDQLSDDIDFEI